MHWDVLSVGPNWFDTIFTISQLTSSYDSVTMPRHWYLRALQYLSNSIPPRPSSTGSTQYPHAQVPQAYRVYTHPPPPLYCTQVQWRNWLSEIFLCNAVWPWKFQWIQKQTMQSHINSTFVVSKGWVSQTSNCRRFVVAAITDCMQNNLGPTYNDPIPQVLATQFDAGGQKCICLSRRICHRGKTVFVQRARSLFVLDSFTHHITCGLVPRSSILPFYGRENIKFIPNLILLSRLL